MLGLEPVQPRQLSGTLQLGWSRLGERPEVGRVPVVRLPPVSAVAQALQRVLPDGLQQSEARLSAEVREKCTELAECVRLLDRSEALVEERTRWAQRLETELSLIRASRWLKLGSKLGLGPTGR